MFLRSEVVKARLGQECTPVEIRPMVKINVTPMRLYALLCTRACTYSLHFACLIVY